MYCENITFMQIWMEIPKVYNKEKYYKICNEIDSARLDREITEKEEETLVEALRAIAEARRIK